MRFFHEGQFDGRTSRLPVQLGRAPDPSPDADVVEFYRRLLSITRDAVFRWGRFSWLDPVESPDSGSTPGILAYAWEAAPESRQIVAVNLSPEPAAASFRLSAPDLAGERLRLSDNLSDWTGEQDGDAVRRNIVRIELDGHGARVLTVGRG
jgi:hypothetical protein